MKRDRLVILLLAIVIIAIAALFLKENASGDVKGTLEGQTYENKFFGFKVTFPDDWSIYDEAKIKEANGYTNGDLDNNAINNIIEENSCYLDEIAGNDDGDSAVVAIYRLSLFESFLYDEDKIANIAASSLKEELEAAGYSNVTVNIEESYSFCGETRNSIKITMKKDGKETVKRQFILKNGRYYGAITISASDSDSIDKISSLFESVE